MFRIDFFVQIGDSIRLGATTIAKTNSERRPSPNDLSRCFGGNEDCRPKLVVSPKAEVRWCSANAERLLSPPLPVRIKGGLLQFDAENRSNRMTEFLGQIAQQPAQHLVRRGPKENWVLIKTWRPEAIPDTVAMVCSLSVPCREIADSGIVEEFDLTPAEASVLALFARLRPPREIAAELGVTVDTVRSHLKRIYSKTSVVSAVQLLQLTHAYTFA